MVTGERGRIAQDGRRSLLRRPSLALLVALTSLVALMSLSGLALLTGIMPVSRASGDAPQVMDEVPVTPMNLGIGPANNSPALVADPTDPRFVVMPNRLDAPDFGCALQVSGDGGRSWLSADPVPALPTGAEKCYAPDAAFDKGGVLYYLFVGLMTPGNEPMGAFLTRSHDRGRTFSAPRQVLGRHNFGVRMAIDPTVGDKGRIHVVWLEATSDPPLGGFGPPPNPILAAYSNDGGETFSIPVQISPSDRARVVAPSLILGPDQAVHVGYYDLGNDARDYNGLEGPTWEGNWSVLVASSFDGGKSFGPSRLVDDAVVPPERVMLIFTMPPPTLAARRDEVCIAWTDARYGDADALLRCSPDKGTTWGASRRLNDDPMGNGRTQQLPKLTLAPNGRMDAVFLDRRDDPEDVSNKVYYTFSTNSGESFAPNVALTGKPSNSRIGQEYVNVSAQGQVEFGSRLALLSRESTVVAAWPDTRNSNPLTTEQDIFATEVRLPYDGSQSPVLRLAGIGLLAVGLLLSAPLIVRSRVRLRARPEPEQTRPARGRRGRPSGT